jgi:predicted PhzF superfamily epimerase YddE/YHI9
MAKKSITKKTTRTSASRAPRRSAASRPKSNAAPPRKSPSVRRVPFYQVDAFTSRLYHGNPAGVVVLEKFLPDDVMQAIAAENNLAETAFIVPVGPASGSTWKIRWFTPVLEMDLCGHATLASAHVLWNHLKIKGDKVTFQSASGPLGVRREDALIQLDFPSRPASKVPMTDMICVALGRPPVELYKARDYLAVFDNKRDVHELRPDFHAMERLDAKVIVTAPGAGHDFVSRFFAPTAGVPEDPVTGSSHCTLIPFWAERLRKNTLTAHQVSHRGGELFCELRGNRVAIGGHAVTYLEGKIAVPA